MSLRNKFNRGLFAAFFASVYLAVGIPPVRSVELFPNPEVQLPGQDAQFCGGGGICCGGWDDC